MGRAATLVALLSASCVSSSSNVCEDGSLCPGGFVCDVPNQRCLLPEQIAECNGKAEDEACVFDGAPGACRVGACIPFFCGDGYVTESAGEECDGENLNGATCNDFGVYDPEAVGLTCTSSCSLYAGSKSVITGLTGCYTSDFCGDAKVNGPELCDGPEQRTCVAIGFDAGTTSCNASCSFSIGDCSRFGWNPESLSEVIALAVAGTAHDNQWAFGLDGKAMQFEGAYWIPRPVGSGPGPMNDLINGWSFASDDTWAVGMSQASPSLTSKLFRWGGIATGWSEVMGVPAAEYIDVWGPSASEVYVASSAGILKFDGSTWTTVAGFTGTPKQLRGSSGNDLWVSTTEGPLMHYNGSTWTNRTPTTPLTMTVQFLDANRPDDVWAIGFDSSDAGKGMIAHWTGSSWQQWAKAQETYNVVAATAPNDAWVGGADGIMRHWDGTAWSRSANIGASPSGLTALSGMIALDPGEIVAVSTLKLAYRYRGQAFGTVKPITNDPFFDPFTAPQNTAFWSSDPDNQYVTNVKGEVWHFDGDAWAPSFTVPNGPIVINDIWGVPTAGTPENVWIVADDGNAYHYDGSTWTPFAVTGVPLERVWLNATDVWVFGANGAYHKNGASWDNTPLSLAGRVASVSGSSSTNLWAVQVEPSSVWKYDGTWTQMTTGASYPELAVAAVADNEVHVTAQEGRFELYNGSTWTESVLPVLDDLRFISYTAKDDVVAASERDLAHFNGRSWSTMRTPVDFVPNTADYLPIVDLHVAPSRIDMLQHRFRIRTLIRSRPLICRLDADGGETGLCSDGVDNDCDGSVDGVDPQCM